MVVNMHTREIGNTGLRVSEIGLGCWTLGGLNWVNGVPNGWANVDDDEAIEAVHYALDQGVNHFDNADVYGNGRAERLLAQALRGRTEEVVVATKVGHFPGTAAHAYEALHIRHQCEQSLKNLGREAIDLYYFHHGDFGPGDRYLAEAVAMARKLQEEGKVRFIGLSAYSEEDFLRLVPVIEPVVLQSWAHAQDDRFIRKGSPVQLLMQQRSISFVAFSPLAQGLLLGKYKSSQPPKFEPGDWRKDNPRFQAQGLAELEPKIEKLKQRFGGSVAEMSRMAQQYVLARQEVCSVIPGFRNKQQVQNNLYAVGKPLTEADLDYIREVLQPAG